MISCFKLWQRVTGCQNGMTDIWLEHTQLYWWQDSHLFA